MEHHDVTNNYFLEGGDAYREWFEAECVADIPEPPYPNGSLEADQWDAGFGDAMDYQLYGYLSTPPDMPPIMPPIKGDT